MRYALTHPVRTLRWWHYRVAYALAKRRRALAALRSERSARRASAKASREAAVSLADRGEVISRTFIGQNGETRDVPSDAPREDWFARRDPLALEGSEGRCGL